MEQECSTGKARYRSPQEAVRAKKRMAKRRNAQPHTNLNHFRCHCCDGWHLGRPRTVGVFKSMKSKYYQPYGRAKYTCS